MKLIAMLIAGLLMGAPASTFACGETTDCTVEGGAYRIRMPQEAAPRGAIIFAHGYQGTAAGTMRSGGLKVMAAERRLALIALDASGADWAIPNAPGHSTDGRDEMAYLDAVVADAVDRFDIPRESLVIAGFSAGGMFTWNVICDRGDAFAGYIPYSGTFWMGPPATCRAGAAKVIHVHGTADRTVPLAGRAIAETRQGDVAESFAMYAQDKGFSAGEGYAIADMSCTHTAAGDRRLDLCLFDGDHDFRATRLAAAYDRLMQ